jgi:CheY-like chemotaxis protein
MERGRVLLVEPEPANRRPYADWLEEAGYAVSVCPGPSAPDYTCVGGRLGRCPLVDPVDAIVLDIDLDSEVEREGTSAFELLSLYTGSGKPVVAVGTDPRIAGVFPERLAAGLLGPASRPQLVRTVGESIARATG